MIEKNRKIEYTIEKRKRGTTLNIKKMTYIAMLTTIALIIFIIELQIPPLVPAIPGIKMGLANIITVYAMFTLGPVATLEILFMRIILGSMFAGQVMSLLYSLSGGLLCYLIMLVMRKVVTVNQIWICSIMGAIFHNIGQILIAMFMTGLVQVAYYLPVLLISAIVSGTFTGLCAQEVVKRMKKIKGIGF